MHLLNMATVLLLLTLVGAEFSVSAFVNPAAWRLDPEPQLQILRRFAFVLGRVMPVWYLADTLMLGIETWLHWHAPQLDLLLATDTIWVLTVLGSIFFEVPLNNRVAEGVADWKRIHRIWDNRNRVRIVALVIAAVLLVNVLVY